MRARTFRGVYIDDDDDDDKDDREIENRELVEPTKARCSSMGKPLIGSTHNYYV